MLLVSNRRNPLENPQKLISVCKKLGKPGETRYYVDGERVSEDVAMKTVDENSNFFMVDFEFGKEGKISEVHLNRTDLS